MPSMISRLNNRNLFTTRSIPPIPILQRAKFSQLMKKKDRKYVPVIRGEDSIDNCECLLKVWLLKLQLA